MNEKTILQNWLYVIAAISDKEYQKRIWIRGEGPEWDNFEETVCSFFDFGNPILENYKKFSIDEKQYQLLIKLRDEFQSFSDEVECGDIPQTFIDTPEWNKIVERAQEVLRAFKYKKKAGLL